MSIWVSSVESSIWVSGISVSESVSGVTGVSVVEVSWISISFSFTLGNNVSGSIWESSIAVSSISYWGGKSLNFYFSWLYFNSFDDSRCTIWVSSIWVSSISSVQEVGISFSLSFGISGSYESEKNDKGLHVVLLIQREAPS